MYSGTHRRAHTLFYIIIIIITGGWHIPFVLFCISSVLLYSEIKCGTSNIGPSRPSVARNPVAIVVCTRKKYKIARVNRVVAESAAQRSVVLRSCTYCSTNRDVLPLFFLFISSRFQSIRTRTVKRSLSLSLYAGDKTDDSIKRNKTST